MATSHDPPELSDDLQPEYDFRSLKGVVRGKYAARYQERFRVVRLAADVSSSFADGAALVAGLATAITALGLGFWASLENTWSEQANAAPGAALEEAP